MRNTRAKPRRRPRGVALIEALIAVLLLSLCALAYAALQLRSLSNNTSSLWRSNAVAMAGAMADRMRANQPGVAAGAYDNLTGGISAPACGSTSPCSPTQTAALDFTSWNTTLARSLPGGSGVVCIDSTPDDGTAAAPACDGVGSTYAVKVYWSEHGNPALVAIEVRP
ncbi:MAG: type IV pilus modification protein PilV [Burkholderiales bacterium]|nr:type IV pilus modification protein PilV [Burkholderiales bacterium]MDE2452967.1 type IV pilus modification protein PilV [Burkholderiales bacterium]